MKQGFEKYIPFTPVDLPNRQWPSRAITKAPVWCSVDLRDGNQALVNPMNVEEKLTFFKMLVDIGFKEIEVGFPSASETEYEFVRALIEGDYIPEDVAIQVLVQAREHLIRRTFESVAGARHVILHFYNSTSTLQRKVVFHKDMRGIADIAVTSARLIRELAEPLIGAGMDIRYEYSPESFSGTEPENALMVCEEVLDTLGATEERRVILNLPNTVECCMPNQHADQIEYFCTHLKNPTRAIVSIHPHNDRGTGVAAAELALLAGAQRVEGTLFGNGERTGNLDIVTVAMNMYSQGIDPGLDFYHLPEIRTIYENNTGMRVHERHPYAGDLVFTAFSGSHQDAIKKGMDYMRDHGGEYWEVPYLPIDPADVGRTYEAIVRINSQSGKGGAAFVLQNSFGFNLPKAMHPEFGELVQKACEETGREMAAAEIMDLFDREYLHADLPYALTAYKLVDDSARHLVNFSGSLQMGERSHRIDGSGNGPIDAFYSALASVGVEPYEFVSYDEHAISEGADAKAVSYIQLKNPDGGGVFGVGVDPNIGVASMKAILCAMNRIEKRRKH